MSEAPPAAVLGAGSWGTTLAWMLCARGEVRLWCRDAKRAAAIARTRRNTRYLPDLALPEAIRVSASLDECLAGAGLVVLATPAQAAREVLSQAAPHWAPDASLLIGSKGLELATGLRMTQVAAETLGEGAAGRVAVLSGPNLSREIVAGLPATTVIASESAAVASALQQRFGSSALRVYTNDDVTGVELGGALKNPIAVAAGICDGLRHGDNAKSALVTRGLAEITRLGVAAGARASTFAGLSGLGDLITTAYSDLSRNHRLGRMLGEGRSLTEAQAALGQVAEGVPTAEAACVLAERLGVEVPIIAELRAVLFRGKPLGEAIGALMQRDLRGER